MKYVYTFVKAVRNDKQGVTFVPAEVKPFEGENEPECDQLAVGHAKAAGLKIEKKVRAS